MAPMHDDRTILGHFPLQLGQRSITSGLTVQVTWEVGFPARAPSNTVELGIDAGSLHQLRHLRRLAAAIDGSDSCTAIDGWDPIRRY